MQEIRFDNYGTVIAMRNIITKNIIPILAILGLLISLELTYVYYNANFAVSSNPSFCTISESINCDAVAQTEFSHFFGIPLSIYGLGFYSVILFLSFLQKLKSSFFKELKHPKSYIFCLSSISIIVSIILAWISSAEIHKICILCYALYFVNLFIWLASMSAASFIDHFKYSIIDAFRFVSNPRPFLLVLIAGIVLISSITYFNISGILKPKGANNQTFRTGDTKIVSGNILGDKQAKLIIHEYTDFECPYCAISNLMLHRLVNEVKGVQVIHHDFPLNKNCNPFMKEAVHKNSCIASLYSRAAKRQGKYWEFNTLLFENQTNLSEQRILELAKSIGLDTNKLKVDAKDPELKEQIINDVKKAKNLGITATPTYIIGMKKYEGLLPYPELKGIVLNNMR